MNAATRSWCRRTDSALVIRRRGRRIHDFHGSGSLQSGVASSGRFELVARNDIERLAGDGKTPARCFR